MLNNNGYGVALYLILVQEYAFGILAKCKEINASHVMGTLGVAKTTLRRSYFNLPHLI